MNIKPHHFGVIIVVLLLCSCKTFAQQAQPTLTADSVSSPVLPKQSKPTVIRESVILPEIRLKRELLWYFGVWGAFNLLQHDARFTHLVNTTSCCGEPFGSVLGTGFSGGIFGTYQYSSFLRFQLRLLLSNSSPEFIRSLPTLTTLNQADEPIPLTREHTFSASMLFGGIEPTLSLRIFDALRFDLGASLAFSINSSYQQFQRNTIEAKDSLSYAYSGTLPVNIPVLSVIAGLSYDIPLQEKLFLSPFIRYYLPLTELTATENMLKFSQNTNTQRFVEPGVWKMSGIQLGLALSWGLYKPQHVETLYFRDTATVITEDSIAALRLLSSTSELRTVTRDGLEMQERIVRESYLREIPRHSALELSLAVVGIGKNGERQKDPTVIVEEFESNEYTPLLPYLFFPEDSSSIGLTRQRLLRSAKEAEQWTESAIQESTLGVFSDVLNILGYRMKKNPSSTLTIVGCNAHIGVESGDTALSMSRAKAVASYLNAVWGINAKRLTLKTQNLPDKHARVDSPDGMEENRRIELRPTPQALLAPIVNEHITRDITPPTLELTPTISSGAGLNWWYMYLKQKGTLLKQFSGSEAPATQLYQLDNAVLEESEAPLAITLQAADAAGQQKTLEKTIRIQQKTVKKKRIELLEDKRIDRFSFIMFDYDKSIVDVDGTKTLLDEVKKKIEPNSIVTITGHGDRSGSKEYNRDLAARRCAEVQKVLQVADRQLVIKPVGNEQLLQDNTLPEGRAYSRVVQIVIETPIKAGTPPKPIKKKK